MMIVFFQDWALTFGRMLKYRRPSVTIRTGAGVKLTS